jgi:hypothetical protein
MNIDATHGRFEMLKERAVTQSSWFEERSQEPAWLVLLEKVCQITRTKVTY